jgi:hypothetical protein
MGTRIIVIIVTSIASRLISQTIKYPKIIEKRINAITNNTMKGKNESINPSKPIMVVIVVAILSRVSLFWGSNIISIKLKKPKEYNIRTSKKYIVIGVFEKLVFISGLTYSEELIKSQLIIIEI